MVLLLLALPHVVCTTWAEESGEAIELDYGFYRARVADLVEQHCAECHADERRTLGRHRLRPPLGDSLRKKDHKKNFRTIRALIVPGNPARSRWILKPLGPHQRGLEHGGGQRIVRGSPAHETMVAFVNGARVPLADATPAPTGRKTSETPAAPAPTGPPPGVLRLSNAVTTLPARAFQREGDITLEASSDVDGARLALRAGRRGGLGRLSFWTEEAGAWLLGIEAIGRGAGTVGVLVDGTWWRELEAAEEGPLSLGADVVLEDGTPLVRPRGRLALGSEGVRMRGRAGSPASWWSKTAIDPLRIEAEVLTAGTEDGEEDCFLLCGDPEAAVFVGRTNGGRRLVMGTRRGGVSEIRASAEVAAADAGGPHTLILERAGALWLGRIGEAAVASLPGSMQTVRTHVGILTHGDVTLRALRVHDGERAHPVRFARATVLRLGAGAHTLEIRLPPNAPDVVAATLRPVGE